MIRLQRAFLVVLLAGVTAVAQAQVNFSSVNVGGSLAPPGSFDVFTDAIGIDFSFDDAIVGDPVDPRRSGNLTISYEATSMMGLVADTIVLSVLGALSGSGTIMLTEQVEDLTPPMPVVIATHMVTLDANSELPYSADLVFSQMSNRVRVTKTLTLNAPATAAFDVANVSLIEQTFVLVPEPAALSMLALAGLIVARRR